MSSMSDRKHDSNFDFKIIFLVLSFFFTYSSSFLEGNIKSRLQFARYATLAASLSLPNTP